MKYLMVLASYPDDRQRFFEQYMSPRNKEYCQEHNTEYIEITQNLSPIRGKTGWIKAFKVKELLNNGELKEGDYLTCLDADICIAKPEKELLTKKSFTYSIDSGNTHCMGAYSVKVNDWSRNLFNLITDEIRYISLINNITKHEYFGHYSSFWQEFYDQASWYSLAGIKRHSQTPFWNLENYGWHSDVTKWTMYSLEELYENVEILPTEWNVTAMEGESDCTFLINKVRKEDTILRHFAGGQPWRQEWFD